MAKYFTINELIHSDTASRLKIDNTPNAAQLANLKELMEALDAIRFTYGKPIRISSGFRCAKLNKAVGGSSTSSHLLGYAADLLPADGRMPDLIEAATQWAKTNSFDQILIEKNSRGSRWVHIGLFNAKGEQRGEIKVLNVK